MGNYTAQIKGLDKKGLSQTEADLRYLQDAPSDDGYYARRNGNWEEVSVDLSEYETITKTVLAKTDDYTVLETDNGKTITMDSTDAKTFTITDGYAVGTTFTLAKINTGKLTIQMSGSETIDDSSAGGTLYSYYPYTQIKGVVTITKVSTTEWIADIGAADWMTT